MTGETALVELRVLDGPNLYFPRPAIKLTLDAAALDGRIVIVDMAHNEASLLALLEVARGLRLPGGRVLAMTGTAGDRTDELIRALGEIAARRANRVVVGEKECYLRGRDRAEMPRLLREGAATVGVTDVPSTPQSWPASRRCWPRRPPATSAP